ncbi:cytochrome b5 reductase 4 isoform X2 [Topomyia yanbarensis]|uniref:cytochrome b5 reductase 4 isoform X2 n=1 Tax=Topomyia yanbarensis TaxID=2498891 RepID=UPI00273CDBC4|nr:cytochrome b5 reductase 4 isoform X2 [Topomyia yanbarensis]XP_058837563.1 cytochrome b5 reductase 4 isoform X2 [Topomyia yanbarensis]XP_058837564.1 cytochrome b5 reductase 4 isoform X2 [Topomyia yanbarensis]
MDYDGNLQVPQTTKNVKNIATSPLKTPVTKQPVKKSTGSATGNPRNKTALMPGHSLMDWIRLGNSGADLTGTGGKVRPVSHAELAQHATREDIWLAIRGKVYNVTRYLDFHPGGIDELMRGAGKDATTLFDEVHAWVNYESLLAKCFVGPLRSTGTLHLGSDSPKTNSSLMPPPPSFPKPPTPTSPQSLATGSSKPATPSVAPKVSSAVSIISSSSDESSGKLLPVVPRFDWIQKTADVSFVFYTRALCNPAVVIEFVNSLEFNVRMFIEGSVLHRYKFQVANNMQWPCSVRQSLETGKVEILFNKLLPGLWVTYGQMEYERKENYEIELYEYDVATRIEITHDSCALLLRPKHNSILQVTPIGHHISVTGSIDGEFVSRSYTPVPANAIPTECPPSFVPLLVKTYPTGGLSQLLTKSVPLATSLQLSQPSGNFALGKLKYHNRIALLAAGSGITPMLALLNYLLERSSNRMESMSLLYFNKTEADIWCREMLDNLCAKDKRLTVRHFLSAPPTSPPRPPDGSPSAIVCDQPVASVAPSSDDSRHSTTSSPASVKPESGRISLEIAQQLTNVDCPLYATYVCLCGPKPFNELSCHYLEQAGHNMTHLHSFQG